ncbi:MAG: monovalent cation/H(+) antiporter subunit G [Candidatus Abyssubacteria bacterium]
MREIISITFMLIGSFFMLMSGLGILRFPDLYMRVSASSKASTLGAGFCLLSLAVYFNELRTTMLALATIAFLVVTVPVGAHLISRAAYHVGVRLWEGTTTDELHGKYDPHTGTVKS